MSSDDLAAQLALSTTENSAAQRKRGEGGEGGRTKKNKKKYKKERKKVRKGKRTLRLLNLRPLVGDSGSRTSQSGLQLFVAAIDSVVWESEGLLSDFSQGVRRK